MSKFKTHYNAAAFPTDREVSTQPSETVPAQRLTLRQILQRQRQGLPVESKSAVYNYDEDTGEAYDLPDLARLDLAELQELREAAALEVERIRDELNRKEQQLRKEREDLALKQIADQRERVQRTTGEGAHQGTNRPTGPQYPLNYRPAGEAPPEATT